MGSEPLGPAVGRGVLGSFGHRLPRPIEVIVDVVEDGRGVAGRDRRRHSPGEQSTRSSIPVAVLVRGTIELRRDEHLHVRGGGRLLQVQRQRLHVRRRQEHGGQDDIGRSTRSLRRRTGRSSDRLPHGGGTGGAAHAPVARPPRWRESGRRSGVVAVREKGSSCDPLSKGEPTVPQGRSLPLDGLQAETWAFRPNFQNCIAHFVALAADKMLALGSGAAAGYNRASPLPGRRRYVRR
jgi:hypothetical protein